MAAPAQRLRTSTMFAGRLGVILVVGLVLRICWVGATAAVSLQGPTDQWSYVRLGTKVADLHRWTAFRSPPLYPLLLGGILWIQRLVGLDQVSLRVTAGVVQALLGTAVVALAALLTLRLAMGQVETARAERAALVAAAGLSIWPNQILGSSVLLTERLATPLFVSLVVVVLWQRRPTRRALAIAGVLLTALVLTRPAAAFVLVAVVPLVLVRSRDGERIRNLGVLALAAIVPMSVWWGYTAWQAGGVLPTGSTTGAFNLCVGNADGSTGYWSDEVIATSCPIPRSGRFASADDAELQTRAVRWMLGHLDQQPRLMRLRARQVFRDDADSLTWLPDWRHYRGPGSLSSWSRVCDLWYRATLWLATPGVIALGWRLRRAAAWLLAIAASTLVGPLLTVGDPRYHEVLLVMAWIGIGHLGGAAWDRASSMVRHHRARAIVSHA